MNPDESSSAKIGMAAMSNLEPILALKTNIRDNQNPECGLTKLVAVFESEFGYVDTAEDFSGDIWEPFPLQPPASTLLDISDITSRDESPRHFHFGWPIAAAVDATANNGLLNINSNEPKLSGHGDPLDWGMPHHDEYGAPYVLVSNPAFSETTSTGATADDMDGETETMITVSTRNLALDCFQERGHSGDTIFTRAPGSIFCVTPCVHGTDYCDFNEGNFDTDLDHTDDGNPYSRTFTNVPRVASDGHSVGATDVKDDGMASTAMGTNHGTDASFGGRLLAKNREYEPSQALKASSKTKQERMETCNGKASRNDLFGDFTDQDVLLGRGGLSNHHIGNKTYLEHKTTLQDRYMAASRSEKTTINKELVQYVVKRGGRFLERDEMKRWTEVPYLKARKKASQTLREKCTPDSLAAKRAKYPRSRVSAAIHLFGH